MLQVLPITQLTPQKLSVKRNNRTGAEGASAWPEDQKRQRERRPGHRQCRFWGGGGTSLISYNSHHTN